MGRCFSGQAEALPCPALASCFKKMRRRNMSRLSTYALAVVICLGTTAMLAISNPNVKQGANAEIRFASDGAFRDGLYLGRLAAEAGRPLRPTIGRWSTDQDRSMFTVGYRRGYGESLAAARANGARAQVTE
jgi:hypothetical protein